MDAKGGGITPAPPEATVVEAASNEMVGGASVIGVFLGLGTGILVTLEALRSQGMTTLNTAGWGALPEPLPEAFVNQKDGVLKV